MKRGLTTRMLTASGLLALVVTGVFAVLIVEIRNLRHAADRSQHSREVLATAADLQKLVLDLETGQRGFVITRAERFLHPWRRALTSYPAQAAELEKLVRDNRSQELRATRITRAINSYVDEYSKPLVATARHSKSDAAEVVAAGDGKRRIDAIRAQFGRLNGSERDLSAARDRAEAAEAERAVLLGAAGLAGSAILIFLFAAYLARAIVVPIRRVAGAAGRLAGGDLSTRVAERAAGEVGELGRAFNAMAGTLQESRDELESQNAELEIQTAELEDQQTQLGAANDELEAQRSELERALTDLAQEKERIGAFYEFGERLAAETEPKSLATVVLKELCDFAAADVGVIYVPGDNGEATLTLADVSGVDPAAIPSELSGHDGLPGRALSERRRVLASHGEAGLPVRALGEDVTVRHELHVPLCHVGHVRGLVTLARLADRPFAAADVEAIDHLADQAAVALSNALTYRSERAAREEAERNSSRLTRLQAVTDAALAHLALDELLDELLERIRDVLEVDTAAILLLESDGKELVARAAKGLEEEVELGFRIAVGQGFAGRVAAERRAVRIDDVDVADIMNPLLREKGVRSMLGVPLLLEGRVVGVLHVGALKPRHFGSDEAELLQLAADRAALAVEHARLFQQAVEAGTINKVVLDATHDGIRLTDLDGNTLVANAAIEHMTADALGLDPELPLVERNLQLAERVTDREAWLAVTEAATADPEREAIDEFELIDSRRSFQRYMAPVRDAQGELIGRIIVMREVTAEREAERVKDELVATVSHELRTPLTSILGFAELMVERKLDDATRDRYLATIHSETQRLTALINDFLDLQRIEEGVFTLALEPFDLGRLLRQQVELFAGQSPEHTLELVLDDDALPVVGEQDRIAQVVANLLSNAIKYSPQGGMVRVAVTQQRGAVRVSVRDEGLGIPGDQQRRIFTKFFRVDSSDTQEIGGTGLGLALCREIVEAHGGRIGFDSVEGLGSTFWFELPSRIRAEADGRVRVLVIEDDPAAAALMSEYLGGDGLAVEVVPSGEQGLARAEQDPPALVCLDIGLAGELDGWQVLSRLKSTPATEHVPVVVCTARDDREQASALGAADFLAKPFSGQQLRDAVARLLPFGEGSVLVVDDEEPVRNLVVETLRADGIEVREAVDGVDALASIAAAKPDALVLDLMMPKLDGFAVLERLQSDPATRGLPVVVLTARRLSAAERRELRLRAVALLEKSSYSARELRRLVQRALGRETELASVGR
jgi:signal transduction histidine kinase/DNA-binding response OmpR family regulator/CHASE3 domain sensor protein